jgi:DNA repair exonuclease SbcCD ATPase subunit
MGLFSKKPKSIIVPRPAPTAKPATDAEPGTATDEADPHAMFKPETAPAPKADVALKPPPPQLPPLPPKPSKKQNKKAKVDPADFLALRSELMHMRARLDESEQSRALLEARLAALDATTTAFASEKTDISEVANMVIQLQHEIASRPVGPVTGETPLTSEAQDELSAKVDALHNRLFGLQDHGPKIAEFEMQLALLRAELEAATAQSTQSATGGIANDLETIEQLAAMQRRVDELDKVRGRLDELDFLSQRVGQVEHLSQRMEQLDTVDQRLSFVDGLASQLQQLNARVSAQAELGGQIASLRERVTQLSEQPAVVADDVGPANDELQSQISQLAERMSVNDNEARAVREHMALLDQRLTNVSTELANQISELGRDIDGLGQRLPEVVDGVVSDEVIDALRGGQVKLANEQARYEIAFREDLAALAEQLRRGTS